MAACISSEDAETEKSVTPTAPALVDVFFHLCCRHGRTSSVICRKCMCSHALLVV